MAQLPKIAMYTLHLVIVSCIVACETFPTTRFAGARKTMLASEESGGLSFTSFKGSKAIGLTTIGLNTLLHRSN